MGADQPKDCPADAGRLREDGGIRRAGDGCTAKVRGPTEIRFLGANTIAEEIELIGHPRVS